MNDNTTLAISNTEKYRRALDYRYVRLQIAASEFGGRSDDPSDFFHQASSTVQLSYLEMDVHSANGRTDTHSAAHQHVNMLGVVPVPCDFGCDGFVHGRDSRERKAAEIARLLKAACLAGVYRQGTEIRLDQSQLFTLRFTLPANPRDFFSRTRGRLAKDDGVRKTC